jgi:Gas vesicle protein K
VTRIEIEPAKIEQGMCRLVLAVVELLRQVMEKQAMRRVDGGGLTDDQIDRLGEALMHMETQIKALQARFDIADLNLDLGPLGTLLDE